MIYNVSIRNTHVEGIVAHEGSSQYFNVDKAHEGVWCDRSVSKVVFIQQRMLEIIQMGKWVAAPLAAPTDNHTYLGHCDAMSYSVLVSV